MGRSVSYPSDATVVTFRCFNFESYGECRNCGTAYNATAEDDEWRCRECGAFLMHLDPADDFDMLIEDFQQHLAHLFPSVQSADDWIGREDHVLAENRLARFGMSEYCGLVAYWIVPQTLGVYDQLSYGLCEAWVRKIADKFVKAFGELSKVGSMSNGEGVYRRIDK